jgi:hypothetical protein
VPWRVHDVGSAIGCTDGVDAPSVLVQLDRAFFCVTTYHITAVSWKWKKMTIKKWIYAPLYVSKKYSQRPNTGPIRFSNGQFWTVLGIQITDHSKTGQICPVLEWSLA